MNSCLFLTIWVLLSHRCHTAVRLVIQVWEQMTARKSRLLMLQWFFHLFGWSRNRESLNVVLIHCLILGPTHIQIVSSPLLQRIWQICEWLICSVRSGDRLRASRSKTRRRKRPRTNEANASFEACWLEIHRFNQLRFMEMTISLRLLPLFGCLAPVSRAHYVRLPIVPMWNKRNNEPMYKTKPKDSKRGTQRGGNLA